MNMCRSIIFISIIFAPVIFAMETDTDSNNYYQFIEDSVTYTQEESCEMYSALLKNDVYSQENKSSDFYNEQNISAKKKIKNGQETIKYYLVQKWSIVPLPHEKNNPALFNSLKKAYKDNPKNITA